MDAFNEQSEDVEVTFVGVPGDNYNEKIMTQLKSKEAPDLFLLGGGVVRGTE